MRLAPSPDHYIVTNSLKNIYFYLILREYSTTAVFRDFSLCEIKCWQQQTTLIVYVTPKLD